MNEKPGSKSLRTPYLWLLGLSGFTLVAGIAALRQWPYLAWPTRTAYSVSLGASLLLGACALWLLSRGMKRAVAWTAVTAGLLLALNQGLGLWFGTLLCYTPG
jgi:hypothetical protein